MIKFKQKGDFSRTTKYFQKAEKAARLPDLDRFGEIGVSALSTATPIDSGRTANSWSYKITRTRQTTTIGFYNDNVQQGVPIAIILQYGHATGNGGYVQGRDYINPSIQPVFDKILDDAWREVTSL